MRRDEIFKEKELESDLWSILKSHPKSLELWIALRTRGVDLMSWILDNKEKIDSSSIFIRWYGKDVAVKNKLLNSKEDLDAFKKHKDFYSTTASFYWNEEDRTWRHLK